ncbi:MAG: hypothetical protein J5526_05750 [Bacteroidales bacterium]|nr:hypothetical protein [Bacteroidales bacterium]
MRNKILFLLTAVIFSTPAISQQITEGSLECLKNEHNINVTIDYSEAIIHQMSEKAFAEYEKDWNVDKKEILIKLLESATDKSKGLITFGINIPTKLSMTVIVHSIQTDGTWSSSAVITNDKKEIQCRIDGVVGKGGRIGSMLNLIKDGSKSTGKVLGEFIKNQYNSR